jgi:hypothetical protein
MILGRRVCSLRDDMRAYLQTPVSLSLAVLFVSLSAAASCSFDTSVSVEGSGAGDDAGFFSSDAGGQADAEGSSNADAQSQDTSPDAAPDVPEGTLRSFPTTSALEMDGDLDAAWQSASFIDYAISDSDQLIVVPNYIPSASVRFASLYDSSKIYFFFEVTDDLLVTDSINLYDDDSIELHIDGLNDRSGPLGDDDHWVVIGSDGNYQSLGPDSISVTGVIKTTPAGYNIEIALNRDELGGASTATTLGFNLGLNDDDGHGNSGVDAYGLWHLPDSPSCASCCTGEADKYAWCDTTRLGQLVLVP